MTRWALQAQMHLQPSWMQKRQDSQYRYSGRRRRITKCQVLPMARVLPPACFFLSITSRHVTLAQPHVNFYYLCAMNGFVDGWVHINAVVALALSCAVLRTVDRSAC